METNAYYNKIQYDGMTIGIIDTISNYKLDGTKQYFQGRLVRCENIKEDTHMVEEINKELMKGVYI